MVQFGAESGGGARRSPVFVGREEQLALALRRWDAAVLGAGHFLLLAGEAGIGKSRLMAEVTNHVGAGVRIATAAAFPREVDTVGGVLLNLADDLRRGGDLGTANALRNRLLATDSWRGDPVHRHRMLVGDLAEIVGGLLAAGPTLLRVEDAHWADELTLEVLERLPDFLRVSPAMVMATYRSDELYPQTALRLWRTGLLGQRRAEEVRLPRLDLRQLTELSEGITGETAALIWVEALYRRSDGIPLHVEELIAGSVDDRVPDTVAEAVLSRVAALDATTRTVVAAASVIGRSFDLDLLGAITGESPDVIDIAIGELTDRSLVVARGDGSSFDFRHMLIRDAIYDDIPPNRRRSVHARVAHEAERAGFRGAYVSDHFERAHLADDAYRHAIAAAEEAQLLCAHREATELYSRAVRTMPPAIGPSDRAEVLTRLGLAQTAVDENQGAFDNWTEAAAIRHELGDVNGEAALAANLMASRHLLGADLAERAAIGQRAIDLLDSRAEDAQPLVRAEVLGAISAAFMLDRRLEDAIRFGEEGKSLVPGPDGSCERLNIDFTLGTVLVFAGRTDEGWDILERAIQRGRSEAFEAESARGYRMIGSSASVLVDYDRAERWIASGLEYCASVERWNDHHYLVAHLAHVYWATGRWRDALTEARRARADGHGITTRITALIAEGYTALGTGRHDDARAMLTEARELGEGMGELQRISPALWGLAELALAEGDIPSAIVLTERGLAASIEVRDAAYAFPFVVTGTRARLADRDVSAAGEWLARCDALLRSRDLPGTLTSLDHAAGLILLAEGQTGKARAALERARDGWAESRRFWEGTAVVLDLATCAVRSRRPAEAAALIDAAREAASGVGAVGLLVRADGIRVDTASVVGDGVLSAREVEVAKLVASGQTNKQIAARLVISPKTVSAHIEHILAKLGASRRAEIAAWVAQLK